VDYLQAVPWQLQRPWCMVGDDVQVAGSFEVDIRKLPLPDWCDEETFDCKAAFRMAPPVPGVTCQDPGNPLFCRNILLQNTQFRVRATRVFVGGIQPMVIAIRDILAPCQSPCGESEITCPNNTCWFHPVFYCQGCLGGEDDVCACLGPMGPSFDGTQCLLSVGDVLHEGQCECGRCRISQAHVAH
jgi:hypothetical protein